MSQIQKFCLAGLGFFCTAALADVSSTLASAFSLSADGLSSLDWSAGQHNGPHNRGQWLPGYDISNDTDFVYPKGRLREYHLDITNTTCNPDGHGKIEGCILVNNQYPGPTIFADWGDTVKITVTNHLQDNGTSLHFHGIQQVNSNLQDGTNGITECPLAPGKQRVYTWRATQHGTSWYHSHHSAQYGAGLLGPIVIRGPVSANYDIDLGPIIMNEWYHRPAFEETVAEEVYTIIEKQPPKYSDNILINGHATDGNGNGTYSKFTLRPGKTHLLRLINTAVFSAMRFSITGHKLVVVAADLVPVEPYEVDSLMVGLAQRYDVLVVANQPANQSYWMRIDSEEGCSTTAKHQGFAVVNYAGSGLAKPKGAEPTTRAFPSTCQAPDVKPIWHEDIGTAADFFKHARTLSLTADPTLPERSNGDLMFWAMNNTALDVLWQKPTRTFIAEHNSSYFPAAAVIELPQDQLWTYWLIQQEGGGWSADAHPIHLHGHDFYTVGKGYGKFDASTAKLNFDNPIRRDTEYVDGDSGKQTGAWLAIAFRTGNPGAWLLHCHIANHIGQGFGVQFVDSKDKIKKPDSDYWQGCADWNHYYKTAYYKKIDSGL